ncbi:Multidrug resistance protein mexB Multidrug-efflux transporter mexB [Salmonella enterica subsp. enterica]|uniref:Multidrug resistance protein mexB Multidrug-efflux transporter mexB n=1 Tax=Salmonella enterica I TaxID=59201 RepID=A0A379W509_SALET|nr:Multidrug resistance protein mexB Multidrug-efflux transporter mexB [Salmonella enterica subsp. enterica]
MRRFSRCKTSLQSAMRKLPQAVQDQGVTVRKTGDTNILTIAFVSTDGSMDKQDIADYVASNIQDPLSRVNGVGDMTLMVHSTLCVSGSIRPN